MNYILLKVVFEGAPQVEGNNYIQNVSAIIKTSDEKVTFPEQTTVSIPMDQPLASLNEVVVEITRQVQVFVDSKYNNAE
jgi:hypothetical protein